MKFILTFCLLALQSWAALPSKSKMEQGLLLGAGFITGGKAGSGFSILDIRLSSAKNEVRERLVFEMGDMYMRPLKGSPPYFHVEKKTNPSRIDISFAQTGVSKVDEKTLMQKLKRSALVLDARMIYDPEDKGILVSIDLKPNALVKVMESEGTQGAAKIVIDLLQ